MTIDLIILEELQEEVNYSEVGTPCRVNSLYYDYYIVIVTIINHYYFKIITGQKLEFPVFTY